MQALSVLPLPHAFLVADEFSSVSAKFDQDFTFNHDDKKFEEKEQQQEFSFACSNPQGSLAAADEIFDNGQIRPIFPIFNQPFLFNVMNDGVASPPQPPLKKVFIEQGGHVCPSIFGPQGAPEGLPYELQCKMMTLRVEMEDSKERSKKSNSTRFSKLWRNSTLNPSAPEKPKKPCRADVKNNLVKKGRRKTMSSSSVLENLYLMNRKSKESNKRRSFLPYNYQLVGFFANVNGLSKNINPF